EGHARLTITLGKRVGELLVAREPGAGPEEANRIRDDVLVGEQLHVLQFNDSRLGRDVEHADLRSGQRRYADVNVNRLVPAPGRDVGLVGGVPFARQLLLGGLRTAALAPAGIAATTGLLVGVAGRRGLPVQVIRQVEDFPHRITLAMRADPD